MAKLGDTIPPKPRWPDPDGDLKACAETASAARAERLRLSDFFDAYAEILMRAVLDCVAQGHPKSREMAEECLKMWEDE